MQLNKRLFVSIVFTLCLGCFSFFYFRVQEVPKVYDCFLFFNELETLKIRLREMNDRVDRFVLVEATETFRGNAKPLYFKENKEQFAPYLHKIIHVVISEKFRMGQGMAREREAFQRNQILRGLKGAASKDIVILSDVDQIIRNRDIPKIISLLRASTSPLIGCGCDYYRWFYNRKDPTPQVGSVVTTYKYLRKRSPVAVRNQRKDYLIYPHGGWHFTDMGGLRTFVQKITSNSHYEEFDTASYRDPNSLYQAIQRLELVDIDDTFPLYLREHKEELLSHHLLDDGISGYQ